MCVCNREFENNACGLLEQLYDIYKYKARELLKPPLQTWNNRDVMQLAYNADLKDFINSDCCQDTLDELWHGKLSTTIPWWKVRLNTDTFVSRH